MPLRGRVLPVGDGRGRAPGRQLGTRGELVTGCCCRGRGRARSGGQPGRLGRAGGREPAGRGLALHDVRGKQLRRAAAERAGLQQQGLGQPRVERPLFRWKFRGAAQS